MAEDAAESGGRKGPQKRSKAGRRINADRLFVSLRQNGVGPSKTCADAILPKGNRQTGLPKPLAIACSASPQLVGPTITLYPLFWKNAATWTIIFSILLISCSEPSPVAWWRWISLPPAHTDPGSDTNSFSNSVSANVFLIPT